MACVHNIHIHKFRLRISTVKQVTNYSYNYHAISKYNYLGYICLLIRFIYIYTQIYMGVKFRRYNGTNYTLIIDRIFYLYQSCQL